MFKTNFAKLYCFINSFDSSDNLDLLKQSENENEVIFYLTLSKELTITLKPQIAVAQQPFCKDLKTEKAIEKAASLTAFHSEQKI